MVADLRTTAIVTIDRIHQGEPTTEDLRVELDPAVGDRIPARLTIWDGWKAKTSRYRSFDMYLVGKGVHEGNGLTFKLLRSKVALKADPGGPPHYGVRIEPGRSECDCRGFYAKERVGQPCKHTAVIEWAVGEKLI